MLCMSTYSERLALAMTVRGLNPHTDHSELARRVGMGCKPQNIQHLLDPNKNAKFSKYSSRIADVLRIDPQWLSYETGPRPEADSGPDVVALDEKSQTLFLAEVKTTAIDLEDAQRQRAHAIVAGLSGSLLTKALALLQDIEERQEDEPTQSGRTIVIEGGKPDPAPPSRNKSSG